MSYVVNQTCPKCGRKSKFQSTDKVRACPLCSTHECGLSKEEWPDGCPDHRPYEDFERTKEPPMPVWAICADTDVKL